MAEAWASGGICGVAHNGSEQAACVGAPREIWEIFGGKNKVQSRNDHVVVTSVFHVKYPIREKIARYSFRRGRFGRKKCNTQHANQLSTDTHALEHTPRVSLEHGFETTGPICPEAASTWLERSPPIQPQGLPCALPWGRLLNQTLWKPLQLRSSTS